MDVMARIGEAVELGRAGDAEDARRRVAELWEDAEVAADPLHRCTLAHFAADLQATVTDELAWDLRALEAADEITAEPAREHHPDLDVAGFYPSLHLNLGDAYQRLGDAAGARHHLERARAAVDRLPEDGYGRMIRAGIEALAQRCGER
jgi:regulator of sirC expression with transglutaminase-like and TPR domain